MISVKEQFSNACGCGSAVSGYVGFDGDNETDEQTSNYLGFSGTEDEGEFDEFRGKFKEKQKIKKDLKAQGYSNKEARQMAREQVNAGGGGGGGIMDAIEKVKGRVQEFRDKAGIGAGAGTGAGATTGGENTGGGGENTSGGSTKGADADSGNEAFNWKPYAIWGGVGIAVLTIGFIAYKKFAKK